MRVYAVYFVALALLGLALGGALAVPPMSLANSAHLGGDKLYATHETLLPTMDDGASFYQNHPYSCWANCFLNMINWRNERLGYPREHVMQWESKTNWDREAAKYLDRCHGGGGLFKSNIGMGIGANKKVMDEACKTLGLITIHANRGQSPLKSWSRWTWSQKLKTFGPIMVACFTPGDSSAARGPHLGIVTAVTSSGKLSLFDPNGGKYRELSPHELGREQDMALEQTLKLADPMSFVAAHFPSTLAKPNPRCGDPKLLGPCDCVPKDLGLYKGTSEEPCADWDGTGSTWCYTSMFCKEGKWGWNGNRYVSCTPKHNPERETKRVEEVTGPCACRSTNHWNYHPTYNGGRTCKDWDKSGYAWCYVKDTDGCNQGVKSKVSGFRYRKC